MGWKSSWNKQDPVEKRRRDLEQQAAAISRQKAALEAELLRRSLNGFEAEDEPQPAVWSDAHREIGFTKEEEWRSRSGRPRVLSVQRYRDRNLFIALASALVILIIFLVRSALR